MSSLKPAVFLDRDGVINEDRADYVKSWEEFRFIRGVRPALRRLREAGIPVMIITNQSAVNRGLISSERLKFIHKKMQQAIRRSGGHISGIYYCPHRPDEDCPCRKPKPGLLVQAARERGLDLKRSIFVGDTWRDLEAGRQADCRVVLVESGQGRGSIAGLLAGNRPSENCFVTRDLGACAALLISLAKNM